MKIITILLNIVLLGLAIFIIINYDIGDEYGLLFIFLITTTIFSIYTITYTKD